MSRPVRPRLGRTQLRKTASSALRVEEQPVSPVAPMEPNAGIAVPPASFSSEAAVVETAQVPPVGEGVLSEVALSEVAGSAIADQPTASMPPTPVIPHPELSGSQPPADDNDKIPDEPLMDATGAMPIWALETIPIFAPRPMPEIKNETTPLEIMLRELRVRKPKMFYMLRTSSRSALASIWLNRLQSLLTTLSIFIGIAAVIVTLVLVQGASAYFTDVLVELGASSVVIDAGTYNNGWDMTSQPVRTLSQRDVQELASVRSVKAVSPIVNLENQAVGYDSQTWRMNVQGVSPSIQDIQGWQLENGLWFSSLDDAGLKQVAVLGSGAAQQFYNESGLDPLGQDIVIGTGSYRVVGILAPQGGYKVDNVIFIPTNTALVRLSSVKGIDRIEIKLDNTTDKYMTMDKMVNILRKNHRLLRGGPNDFQINATDELIQLTDQQLRAMNILLIGTAIILLVAGGIGIINIMLASVSRRTREIGVRIAVGARRNDIRNQFLIEAVLLSLAGGVLGMLGGLGIGFELMKLVGAPFIIDTVTYVLPFAISLFIGIVFGLYPAIQAARLEPVVALQSS